MQSHLPHEAIVQSSAGPPYEGAAGRTRTERVHLVGEGGALRSVEVYRVINTATHPELKALALAGQLHRLEDGRELAIPFVYHDPQSRKFALVVPSALAHLEMKEWTRLMSEVAEDTGYPVPAYVRDCTTVLGLGALELFLESGVEPEDGELTEFDSARASALIGRAEQHEREHQLMERERLLLEREREVADQERSLIRLAGDLTSREGSILRREEELATARADLEVREADLSVSSTRPPGYDHDADVVPDGEWQEVGAGEVGAGGGIGAGSGVGIGASGGAGNALLDALDPSGEMASLGMRRRASYAPPNRGFAHQQEEPTVVAALARVAAQGVYSEPGLGPTSTEPPPLPHAGPHAPPPLRPSRSTAPPPLHRETGTGRIPMPVRPDSQRLATEAALLSAAPARTNDASRPAGLPRPPTGTMGSSRGSQVGPAPEGETRIAASHPTASSLSPANAAASRGSLTPPIALESPDPGLGALPLAALHALLEDPRRRVAALLELARRRDPESIPQVAAWLDDLPPEQVIYAAACLAAMGERAAESLIAGLTATRSEARHSCAIALGRLKLRRGLAPLLEQLEVEPSSVWQELARATGDFGLAALRSLARGIHGSQRRERLMVALAHLANHGCASDLETMERDPDAVLALAARQALARRSRLQWEDEAVRNGGTLRDASPEARLSQAMYAVLERVGLSN